MVRWSPRASALVVAALILVAGPRHTYAEDDGLPTTDLPRARPRVRTVTTRFDPNRDGFPFVNHGDYVQPGGNCLGMSLMAIDNFRNRRLAERHRSTPLPSHEPTDQETVSLAQGLAGKVDYRDRADEPVALGPLSDPSAISGALARMRRTGQPEVLVMAASPTESHATVLYGYRNGNLLIYDPNRPGTTVEWPWSETTGLGTHPLAAGSTFYSSLTTAGSAPFESFRASRQLTAVRLACEVGAPQCVGRYPTVEANVARDAAGTATITGRVSGGPPSSVTVDGVYVSIDGRVEAWASVAADGTFTVTVDPARFEGGRHTLRVVAVGGNQFSGYTERTGVTLDPAPAPAPAPRTGLAQALTKATSR